MLTHPQLTEGRIAKSIPRIEKLIYPQTVPLEIAAWTAPGEPVAAAHALKQKFVPFKAGDSWGTLWSTTWFRFRGTIPKEWKGREVVARVRLVTGGAEGFTAEGLIYREGKVDRALNVNRAEVEITPKARGGESFEFFVEAAANGGVDNAGRITPQARGVPLTVAELAAPDRAAQAFHFDFKAAALAMAELPEESTRHAQLRRILNDTLNALDLEDPATIPAARRLVRRAFEPRNGATNHRVSAVGHAHIDTAWLWPLRESIRKCARTFSTMVDYMEKYPKFVFGCSQAQQYAWMKVLYPDVYERMKKMIKRGQFEPIGSMWIEADCNLVSGESLIRQIVYGKQYFRREFGFETRDCWIPDVFGYSGAMPQILVGCDVDSFLTQKISWNQFNKFPHHTFWWEGIDGSRIFSHFPPCDTYNAAPDPKTIRRAETNFRNKDRATRSLMPFGFGDGGGGPSIENLEFVQRFGNFEGLPEVQFDTVANFFRQAKAEAEDLPVWSGELYLELHRGTYTTQARNKRGNRKSELALRDAEFFDAVSRTLAPEHPERAVNPARAVYDVNEDPSADPHAHRTALDRAWKLTLLNQFHDIIPGSSIAWVYEDSARDYATIGELANSVSESSLRALELLIDTTGYRKPVIALNPLGIRRREVVELPSGKYRAVDVPPCGYAVIESARPETGELPPVNAKRSLTGITLDNGLLRLKLNRRGQLTSLFDLAAKREVLAEGETGNRLELHPDYPNAWDAWDVDAFSREVSESIGDAATIELAVDDPLRAVVKLEYRFGASRLVQEIALTAGSRRVDFITEVDWHENHRLLDVAFPVAIRSSRATYEVQFGHVERPTHFNTSWDVARFTVCGQRWADLGEAGYGVALLNDCKYGYDIHGNVLRLSLLRAPGEPDPQADRGHHTFTYSLLPHAGGFQEAGVIDEAAKLNTPLRFVPAKEHAGVLPAAHSFFSVSNPGLVIDTVKRAQDSDDVVVRLYESHGARGSAELAANLPFSKVERVNLIERSLHSEKAKGGRVSFDFRPFEILTFKFVR